MKAILKFVIGAFAALAMFSSAYAADPVESYNTETVDWDGFYAGIVGGALINNIGIWGEVGGAVGYNHTYKGFFGDHEMLFNIEGSLSAYRGPTTGWEAELTSRGGFVLDDIILYSLSGIGNDTGAFYRVSGLGLWGKVTDDFSLRGEVTANTYFTSGFFAMPDWYAVKGGAFWHFQ